ncbi:hypothetical protein [endosymbiont GvMRE of Glomus versiforme]|uniref:hypothetical protein n=1 Tax=endosymbiont GvMRE of Glomus versiforme TaxID=2039283 RepID=UPI000EED7361|nr:hypothetical protein [endosymbiont GvMRE of Glomus versiforme]RHZ36832.1 hypothetical protein GvMRE_I2g299 [endosymbiont GvMRE of Glomus versiforme]
MKLPCWKLFLIKKLTIWPRAIIYLSVYLVLGFTYTLNTTVDTNWNVRILGIINKLLPNKGIVKIILFLLVKIMIFFCLVFFLECLFAKLSKINISSKEFLQIVVNRNFSLNGENYRIKEVVLINNQKKKRLSGKLSVCEEDFEVNFSVFLKGLKLVKEKEYIKEISWWGVNGSKLLFSLILSLVMICLFATIGFFGLF